MKYELTAVSETGDTMILTYDNLTGKLENHEGDVIVPKLTPFGVNKDISPGGKSGDVKVLKIQLGLKCNFSCSYCLQLPEVEKAATTTMDDIDSFLANMDTWITSAPNKIEFWGGEPLVYFKKLKRLVPALAEKYPNASFSMITNGSLLNDEKADFLIKYKFGIGVSHDALGQSTRGYDPLETDDVVAALKKLLNSEDAGIGFNFMLGKHNKSISLSANYFKSIFGEHVPLTIADIVSFYDANLGVEHTFTDEELTSFMDEVFYDLTNTDQSLVNIGGVGDRLDRILRGFTDGFDIASDGSKCGMDREDSISVDLKGDIATCQNVAPLGEHYVGSVYDLKNAKMVSSKHWSHRKNCSECMVLATCGGGCMFQDDTLFQASCRNHFAFNLALFKVAFLSTTGYMLTSAKRMDGLIEVAHVD